MIEQICAFIHNYFVGENGQLYGWHAGEYTIAGGELDLPFLLNGQYFIISGSKLNDGVYQYPVTTPQGQEPILKDETFNGAIYEMRPPRAFLALVSEIEEWQIKYGAAIAGPYQSESFGGYSYTLKSGSNASGQNDNSAAGWQGVFRTRLKEWRKLA